MKIAFRIACLGFLSFSLFLPSAGFSRQSGSQPSSTQSGTTTGAKKSSGRSAPSPQDIADAKAKGLVWVNLGTHVYHKEGALYGTTKRGKFMTEDDAKKAGYRLAKENESSKTSAPPANPK